MGDVTAAIPEVAGGVSLVKVIVMIVLAFPWLWSMPWVYHDMRRFHGSGWYWPAAGLAAGTGAFVAWLLIPFYLAGLVIFVVITSGVLAAYIVWHNGRVDGPDQITWSILVRRFRMVRHPGRAAAGVDIMQLVYLYDYTDHLVIPGEGEASAAETFNRVQQLMSEIVGRRASEAEISPGKQRASIRLVVDGEIVDLSGMNVPPGEAEAMIQALKASGGMNVEDRRRPQEGRVSADGPAGRLDIDLISAGTTGGQRMQFLVLQEASRTDLDDLGMSEEVLGRVKEIIQADSGLLICCGQPKSGITSTMYSLLRQHDAFLKQLVTVEARARVDLENVTQNEYRQARQLPAVLASVLRRKPDVVLVDRCPDEETARLVLGAAAEKPILLGLHGGDTFVTLARWVKICGGAAPAVKDLRAVLCQILLRRLCPQCKEGYDPDPQLLAKANLTGMDIDRFYRARTKPLTDERGTPYTCPACGGVGYRGRVGAFEMLEMTDELRQLIVVGAPVAQIKAECRKHKMLYLQEQALRKVVEGVIDVKEVIRATQTAKKA